MGSLRSWLPFFRALDSLDSIDSGRKYPRYVRTQAANARWKGPFYLKGKQWRHDLLLVIEQIRLCIQANAPLSPAFTMAAEDYLDTDSGWSPERVSRLVKLAGLAILMSLAGLGALDQMLTDDDEAGPAALQLLVLSGWFLLVLLRQSYKPAAVFIALRNHVERGCTLSEAMGRLSRFFPRNLVTMVAMAEDTGRLNLVLDRFSAETIKLWTVQRDLNRVLTYFYVLISIQCMIGLFIMVKTIPVFHEILSELGVRASQQAPAPQMLIPLPTLDTMIAVFDWVVYNWPQATTAVCWLVILWIAIRSRLGRRGWSSRRMSTLLLAVPGLRGMVARQNLGTAAFMLHQMLQAGIPLEKALGTVANGDLHRVYRRWFARVRRRLLNGDSLKDACTGIRLFAPVPRSFVALIGMGESCGRLEDALDYIAEQYFAQVERRRKFLLSCVLPLGVMISGYLALSIEASVFHMMIALADSILS